MNSTEQSTLRSGAACGSDRRRCGFTLLEVAIAIAVVVIGILALFALISAGLDASSRAVADTQAAMFADSVFNGIKASSLKASEKGKNAAGDIVWRIFWYDFQDGATNITVAADTQWKPVLTTLTDPRGGTYTANRPLTVYGDGTRGGRSGYGNVYVLKYEAVPTHASTVDGIVNHALRYCLVVDGNGDVNFAATDWFTDRSNVRIPVELLVWPGEFGDVSEEEPIYFYTEFDNPGDL